MIIDTMPDEYKLPSVLIKRIAAEKQMSATLLASIIIVESGGRKYAAQYQPNYRYFYKVNEFATRLGISPETEKVYQATSVGLMQIMLSTARSLGFKGQFPELFDPETNIRYGSEYLKRLLNRHQNTEDAISAYNAGQPFKDSHGMYKNEQYVYRVMSLKGKLDIWF